MVDISYTKRTSFNRKSSKRGSSFRLISKLEMLSFMEEHGFGTDIRAFRAHLRRLMSREMMLWLAY